MGEDVNTDATQPSLLDPTFSTSQESPQQHWAGVAQIAIDSPLPHLDRLFDYGIPEKMEDSAVPGARVSVKFGGRNLDGFIADVSPVITGVDLKPLRRVIGQVPVLTPEVLELCRRVAGHYAGGLADVLRLAVPPRHATVERQVLSHESADQPILQTHYSHDAWDLYTAGQAFLRRIGSGESPRAVWSALPTPSGQDTPQWARAISQATVATLSSDRGVLIVVPTNEDMTSMGEALTESRVPYVPLTADLGPSVRYKNFLDVLLGRTRVVLGTRAAAYAPVHDLGLVVCWDEAHDAHQEPRAPYPHVREVLGMRAEAEGAAALFGGFARTPWAQHLVRTGWAHHLGAQRQVVRANTPRIIVPDEFDKQREGALGRARIPGFAWRRITQTLKKHPVLVQVPRAGFTPNLSCAECHRTARCAHCHGPLAAFEADRVACTWCGRSAKDWSCPHCRNTTWRARRVGARRTAEELGRAFPGVPIRVSGSGAGRIDLVPDTPALIIATPGAEPPAVNGYALTVLLDGEVLTDLPLLDAAIHALRKWFRAASLTSGEVLLLGDPLTAPAQAFLRWDPAGYAQRELGEWDSLGFPPTHTLVTITGERPDITGFVNYLPDVDGTTVLGPVPVPGEVTRPSGDGLGIALRSTQARLVLSIPASAHDTLTDAVRSAVRIRSARRDGRPVKVRVNPIDEI